MADGYHINGPALVYTGTGSAGALELLGYTVDGVDISISKNVAEIITDLFGPMTPQDFQDMGEVASITCPLIVSYREVLSRVANRGDRGAVGQMNTPGLVLGQTGAAFSVGITSTDSPWLFAKAVVRPDMRAKLATKAHPFVLQLFAWPYAAYTALTGQNVPLYTRSLA
jgi:hypothetical protein